MRQVDKRGGFLEFLRRESRVAGNAFRERAEQRLDYRSSKIRKPVGSPAVSKESRIQLAEKSAAEIALRLSLRPARPVIQLYRMRTLSFGRGGLPSFATR